MTTDIFGDLNTVFGGALRSASPVAGRSLRTAPQSRSLHLSLRHQKSKPGISGGGNLGSSF
ncbi:hypothetical protein FD12_GL002118 [Lentilactobacillus rapi DSM 19907 = JCM 15042]|uniref:Uncharacterized protein n=2 Tax=Lentilactobacillus rapi TaxID=481723 RepID=A0A512PR97_9LACO|nr:hypothetical protein [Lentilactobacillus rapi]KRL17068.1 hypothetical protein FD12_GL002118 [Lentilactobacillus rapi DSM 19907 = JCM 15042]GEP73728.1 hypothetical protein LRA02_25960 [Lentilactobacillus rapi]